MVTLTDRPLAKRIDAPTPKRFRDGTDRWRSPEDTLARVLPLARQMGITRVANITGLDCVGIPVATACRPNTRGLATAQGKGLTLAAAKASALMESVECYHAERITHPLVLGSVEDLRGTLPLADIGGLATTERSRFHPARPLLWIEGFDLIVRAPRWVPFETVHTNYTTAMQGLSGNFVASTNGLASGNQHVEALSHAICEVVERDATTLWDLRHRNGDDDGCLEIATVDDPACCRLLEMMERAGVQVGLWEATSDVGIPTYVCSILDQRDDPLHVLYAATGMGCHPRREIALARALTEAAQSRLTAIAGAREDITVQDYQRLRDRALLAEQRDMLASASARRSFHAAPSWDTESFTEDVAWELIRLQLAGITQVIAVDLTGALDIPVVRVVIPGLEGSHRTPGYRYGRRAQRLYAEAS